MNKKIWGLSLIFLIACNSTPPLKSDAPGEFLSTQVDKFHRLAVDNPELKTFYNGQTDFAIDLYKTVSNTDQNLFISPFSVTNALSMVYAGASGDTKKQIAQAMHIESSSDFHGAMSTLLQELDFLKIDNNVWIQKGYPLQANYLNVLGQYYNSGVHAVDFATQPESVRQSINAWIAKRTENRIQDLLSSGSIQSNSRLILTNSVYFKAKWMEPFSAADKQNFHLLNGQTVLTNMMSLESNFNYFRGEHYEAIEIPYDGNSGARMVFIIPQAFHAFQNQLNSSQLNYIFSKLEERKVNLTLPKFSFKNSFNLVDTLKTLGIQNAFNANQADFSGIDGTRNLYISDVSHQTFIQIDENGTEAAAATDAGMNAGAVPPTPEEPINLTVDKPFIFFIRDNPYQTGNVLFIGHFLKPEEYAK